MSIDYSMYVAYGFPAGRKIKEEGDELLIKELRKEGLTELWSGDMMCGTNHQDFIVVKNSIKELECDGSCLFINELLNKDIDQISKTNLIERAKEMNINEDKIGWYIITVIS